MFSFTPKNCLPCLTKEKVFTLAGPLSTQGHRHGGATLFQGWAFAAELGGVGYSWLSTQESTAELPDPSLSPLNF